MSIAISLTTNLIYGHDFLLRRSIEQPTGGSSTTWVDLLSTIISATLRWQQSATSFRPTLHSTGSTQYPMPWELTLGNSAKHRTIVWLNETIFSFIITYGLSMAILLNALSSSCNSLCSGNMWCMPQQMNSMMLMNISTQRWNQATGGGMNRYVSQISS